VDDSQSSQLHKPLGGRILIVKDHSTRRIVRFGVFEVDLQTGELRRAGLRINLQAQPFRVLSLLLERPGEIVTRAEIVQVLWGNGIFVDFDQSVGAVIRKLRAALGDSATAPRYIETLRHRGYRFLLPCETDDAPSGLARVSAAPIPGVNSPVRGSHISIGLSAAMALALILLLWSVRPSESAGSSQNEIAHKASKSPQNVEAYLAYQKGRYLWRTRAAAAVETSIEYFQQALDLDPDYAPAYAGIADAYAILNFYTGQQRNTSMERAKAAIQRALKLDQSLAEAHATQAYIKFYYEWDWPGAESGFRKAIALNPNYATAHQWYAEYLFYMERFQEALREINKAHELDPQSVVINLQLASPYMFSRKYEQAIQKIREALRLNPEFPLAIYMLGTCYEQLGRLDEALSEYQKISGTKLGLTGLGYAYGRSGRQKEARQILRQLLGDSSRHDLSAYHVARVYAGLGETSQTFAWLKKAQDSRDERIVMLKVDPKLDSLRSNPLFGEMLRSLGLV
jgi:tetratricopeptide (TPR) repeat protein